MPDPFGLKLGSVHRMAVLSNPVPDVAHVALDWQSDNVFLIHALTGERRRLAVPGMRLASGRPYVELLQEGGSSICRFDGYDEYVFDLLRMNIVTINGQDGYYVAGPGGDDLVEFTEFAVLQGWHMDFA